MPRLQPGTAGDTADGCSVDAEEPRDVCGRAACVQHGEHFGLLLGGELGLPPAVAALTLGLVGRAAMSRRTGRNEAFNHGGNVVAAALAGGLAYLFGYGALFLLVAGMAAASAVAILCAARRGLPVALHTPSEVKAAVTGSGRADKAQVGAMVTRLLRLDAPPKPADAADALALAICAIWRGGADRRRREALDHVTALQQARTVGRTA